MSTSQSEQPAASRNEVAHCVIRQYSESSSSTRTSNRSCSSVSKDGSGGFHFQRCAGNVVLVTERDSAIRCECRAYTPAAPAPVLVVFRPRTSVAWQWSKKSNVQSGHNFGHTAKSPATPRYTCTWKYLIVEKLLARPERLELPTYWFEASRSIRLSYGRAPRGTNTV